MSCRSLIYMLILAAATCPLADAADLKTAAAEARTDLNQALDALTELRADISRERIPMARELRQLEAGVLSLRADVNRLQRLGDSRSVDLDTLRNEVVARENEWQYVNDLLNDYLQGFETRINHTEWQTWHDRIQQLGGSALAVDSNDAEVPKAMRLLTMTTGRAEQLPGGRRFKGSAIDSEGVVTEGDFLSIGPVAAFSNGTAVTGLAIDGPTLQPRVIAIDDSTAAISALVANGTGLLPVDPTQGDALRVAASRDTLQQRIQKGGLWIWPILTFGFAALVVTIVKAIQILTIKEPTADAIEAFSCAFGSGDRQSAISQAAAMPKPFNSVFSGLAATIQQPREAQEEIAFERGLEVQLRLERWLPFLALTAATTPLLGLLGTVTGMIKTFNLIQIFGTGDAGRLAGGISEALVTTEFGLLVAIPALIAHAFLARRARGVLSSIESISGSILHRDPNPAPPSVEQ